MLGSKVIFEPGNLPVANGVCSVQAPENFQSIKGQRSRFGPAPHQLG